MTELTEQLHSNTARESYNLIVTSKYRRLDYKPIGLKQQQSSKQWIATFLVNKSFAHFLLETGNGQMLWRPQHRVLAQSTLTWLRIHPGIAPEWFLGETMSTYKYPKGFVNIPSEKPWGSSTELEFAPAYIDHVLSFIKSQSQRLLGHPPNTRKQLHWARKRTQTDEMVRDNSAFNRP